MAFFSETFWLMRDSVTAAPAYGLATERIDLGFTQVVRLRSPVTMAQTLASLDELTGGRVVVCPGACTANHARRFGLEPTDPLGTLREWVESIRLVLTGEQVSYHGRFVTFEDVELEFTESIFMPNSELASSKLLELKSLGVHCCIDDFGTGYSSLSYLRYLPICKLKLDQSFVSSLTTDTNDEAISKAIISMAHSLNLKVTAEGVETLEQLERHRQSTKV